MSELTPEELKIIAEGMGYEVTLGTAAQWEGVVLIWDKDKRTPYNPLINDTQCMEIMEKLLNSNTTLLFQKIKNTVIFDYVKNDNYRPDGVQRGKTINEAVCKAALEYFKEAK